MPAYIYLAENLETGQQNLRTALAESVPRLVERALEEGERVVQFTEITRRPWSRVPLRIEDRAALYRHLASLLEAGMPLVEALQLLGRETTHEGLRLALRDVSQRMRMGEAFAEAAVRYPEVFDEHLVRVLQAAEKGGGLDVALREMADHLEEMAELNHRLAPLFIYPGAVMTVLAGICSFFFLFALPRFLQVYRELGVRELPLLTRILQAIGPGIAALLGLVVALVLTGLLLRWYWPPLYFHILHWLGPRLPLGPWQEILYQVEMTRFVTTLSVLLRRGVSLVPALQLAAETLSHSLYRKAALRCAGLVGLGHRFSEALREVEVFPESLLVQIALAEKEGDLAEPLARLGHLYRHQAEYLAQRGLRLLEPALILGVGSLVFLTLLSIFAPLIHMVQQLSGGESL